MARGDATETAAEKRIEIRLEEFKNDLKNEFKNAKNELKNEINKLSKQIEEVLNAIRELRKNEETTKDNSPNEQKDGFEIVCATTETQEQNQELNKSHVLEFAIERDNSGTRKKPINKGVVEEKPEHVVTCEKSEGKPDQGVEGNSDTFACLGQTEASSRIEGTPSDLESKNRSHEPAHLKLHATAEFIPPTPPPKPLDLSTLKNGEGREKGDEMERRKKSKGASKPPQPSPKLPMSPTLEPPEPKPPDLCDPVGREGWTNARSKKGGKKNKSGVQSSWSPERPVVVTSRGGMWWRSRSTSNATGAHEETRRRSKAREGACHISVHSRLKCSLGPMDLGQVRIEGLQNFTNDNPNLSCTSSTRSFGQILHSIGLIPNLRSLRPENFRFHHMLMQEISHWA